jgi:regulator of sigma E protease
MNVTEILTNALTFIVAIGILVAVHEFGHFWVARRLGIKVLRFSIGFGKVLWSRYDKHGTEFAISAIPLGGYVRMVDERDAEVKDADRPFAFNRQPVWKRIAVLLAGPGFNFVFAIAAYWALFVSGIPGYTPVIGEVKANSLAAEAGLRPGDRIVSIAARDVQTREAAVLELIRELVDDGIVDMRVRATDGSERGLQLQAVDRSRELTEPNALLPGLGFSFWFPDVPAVIGQVQPDGAAAKAGLQSGDEILRFDGQDVADFNALRALIEARPDRSVGVSLRRAGQLLDVTVIVGSAIADGRVVGRLGIGNAPVEIPAEMQTLQRYGALAAFGNAAVKTWDTSVLTVNLLWNVVTGKVSMKSISGPVGIATVTGFAAKQGVIAFVGLLALISISLGVLNLLPIPILDGGQVVYQVAELVKGGPVSERAQMLGQQVGIVLLILLMGVALFNDLTVHVG